MSKPRYKCKPQPVKVLNRRHKPKRAIHRANPVTVTHTAPTAKAQSKTHRPPLTLEQYWLKRVPLEPPMKKKVNKPIEGKRLHERAR